MPLGYPAVRPLSLAVRRALSQRKGWGTGEQPFNPGLWNHAAATASGGSQILGVNRYRIYSATGAISQVTVPAALVAGRAYQFQMTFETPVLGTQLQVGDAGANTDDFVSSLAGTRTVAFVADGTVATIKRPYVVNAGQPTDVVVKNVAVTDITATALNITSQPQARSIVDGNTTTFSVTVAAPFSAVHYQWEVSTNGGSTWAAYVGGTGAITNTLTTAAMTTADNGELFRCRIRMGNANNTIGQIYSNAATLTVTAANANPVAPTLALGDLTVGTGVVKSSADLLAGATDADGDTLTVTSVTAVSGGTVTGSAPWTITPTAEGAGSATVVISDGRGGSVNRTVTWNGVAAPAIPTISGVTGTISHGQTITVSGTGLGQAPTLLRLSGDEGAAGASVGDTLGLTVHGVGARWLFESGGTMVLDMQTQQPETIYKPLGASQQEYFLYFERRYSDVGPLVVDGEGFKGQVKEFRVAGDDAMGEHGDEPSTGTIWQAENDQIQWMTGNSNNQQTYGVDRSVMTQWSSQFATGRMIDGGSSTIDYEVYGEGVANNSVSLTGTVVDDSGWGQVFLPFYKTDGFAVTLQMRNVVMLASRQRFEIGNNANRALCNRVVVQHATAANATSATIPLDLTRFAPTDGLYLFAVNANGEWSVAHELRAPVTDTYDPLADDYGLIRARLGAVDLPDYSTAASAADSIEFQFGFRVDALDSYTAGTPIGICLTKHSAAGSAYRGLLRIDHVTGNVTITSMVNNTTLTLATGTDFHTALGVRRDWKLIIPKATGATIELRNASGNALIGSATRTSTFDGWWPQRWMFNNNLAAQGAVNGRLFYQRASATTAGVTAPLFDMRYTLAQSGLTSVPSAHDSGFLATLASGITWGAA